MEFIFLKYFSQYIIYSSHFPMNFMPLQLNKNSIVFTYHIYPSSVDGHLSRFYLLATGSSASVSKDGRASLWQNIVLWVHAKKWSSWAI